MLDPEYLKHCTDELEALFADLETSILEDVARRIAENKYASTSTAQHQLNRAKALGLQYADVKKRIADILDISEAKVADIITEASYGSIGKDNIIFKQAYEKGIIHKFNYDEAGMKGIILSGIKSTNSEMRNICKTTAKTAKSLLANALDMTYLSIQSGAFDQQTAIKMAVNDLAKRGITWIDYESGAHRRLDSTIRSAIRSGINQTACKCQDKNFEDMGGNLVEVTSHMGARPSHAEWQGKIYWRKKQYKNYRNFEEATGYGTGDGLGGWNCRHSFFPYFEGLSSKSFEHYRLTGNEDRYEHDQQQRYNERKIREWKRREAVNKAGGVDTTREARKVKEWKKRQTDFLKSHPDMKRNYGREMLLDLHQNGVSMRLIPNDAIYHNNKGIWLHGAYKPKYRTKLLELHKEIANVGYNSVEHALNKLQGRISSGRITDIEAVKKVLTKPINYHDAQGNPTKYYDGISVHFDKVTGYIITIINRKRAGKGWKKNE